MYEKNGCLDNIIIIEKVDIIHIGTTKRVQYNMFQGDNRRLWPYD